MKKIEELAEAFLDGSDEFSFVYDVEKEEVYLLSEVDEDEEYLPIPQMSSPEAYRLMEDFANEQDDKIREELLNALKGKKPFRSFKDQIKGQDIENKWYEFENAYAKEQMSEWLKEL